MVDDAPRQHVLNFLAVFYSGDTEGALSCCTDDVEFFANAPIDILPHMGHHHGKAEVRAMWQTVHARYSGMRYEIPILVAEADKVAANIRVFFRKSSNNRVVQFDMAAFYTLRDGRIAGEFAAGSYRLNAIGACMTGRGQWQITHVGRDGLTARPGAISALTMKRAASIC